MSPSKMHRNEDARLRVRTPLLGILLMLMISPSWSYQISAFQKHVGIQKHPSLACKPASSISKRNPSSICSTRCMTIASGSYAAGDAAELRKNPSLYSKEVAPPSKKSKETNGHTHLKKPEILAPAGGWAQLKAAVENGADAVYFGLDHFNARARASNFKADTELPEVMRYLHQHGVHGYVALNILVFDTELEELETMVRMIAAAGVDAVIVQDLGAVRLIKEIAPNLEVHGSTQMSITSAQGAQFAKRHGVSRVVLGRELSVKEIAMVQEEYDDEIEVFVHGALCVSYSGQCFSSEAWGGRSANRGQCAQACRMPYGLVVEGELREMNDIKYLLSPQDLMAVELVPDLIKAGVSCFKIEGRLKGPEYVALTTKVYREAVDKAWATLKDGKETKGAGKLLTKEVELELAQVFARGQDAQHGGLTPGFLEGPKHQRLVRGRNPRHRGVCIGEVVGVAPAGVKVQLRGAVKRGDGVVFDCGRPEEKEEGGSVYEVIDARGRSVGLVGEDAVSSGVVTLTFGKGAVDTRYVMKGDLVWRNRDAALDKKLEALAKGGKGGTDERVGVHVQVSASQGSPLVIEVHDEQGRVGVGRTKSNVDAARSKDIDHDSVSKAVGSLGGTCLRVLGIDSSGLARGLFVPVSEVKEARREAVDALVTERIRHGVAEGMKHETVLPALLAHGDAELQSRDEDFSPDAKVRVLCRTRAQAEAAVKVDWLDEITLDFLEVHGLVEAVASVRAAGKKCVVATPRVLKPDEERMWRFYLKLGADALLIRSAGMLQQLLDLGGTGGVVGGATIPALYGDFSLNAANVISARGMLREGLSRLTPTHDLDAHQLMELSSALGPLSSKLECIVHQHLPIFHTEHCVFCRFLSNGSSYKDCGHPCESNTVHLRDSDGADHLVLADMGCRNTVFNAQAQSGAYFATQLFQSGYKSFRIELVDEPAYQVLPLLEGYKRLLEGGISARDWWTDLQDIPDANGAPQGVNSGSLRPGSERRRDHDEMKRTATQLDPKWAAKGLS